MIIVFFTITLFHLFLILFIPYYFAKGVWSSAYIGWHIFNAAVGYFEFSLYWLTHIIQVIILLLYNKKSIKRKKMLSDCIALTFFSVVCSILTNEIILRILGGLV